MDIIQNQVYSHLRLFHDLSEKRNNGRKKDIDELGPPSMKRPKMSNGLNDEFKRCRKCNSVLPANNEFFPRNKQNVGGLHSYCKKCKNGYKKKVN